MSSDSGDETVLIGFDEAKPTDLDETISSFSYDSVGDTVPMDFDGLISEITAVTKSLKHLSFRATKGKSQSPREKIALKKERDSDAAADIMKKKLLMVDVNDDNKDLEQLIIQQIIELDERNTRIAELEHVVAQQTSERFQQSQTLNERNDHICQLEQLVSQLDAANNRIYDLEQMVAKKKTEFETALSQHNTSLKIRDNRISELEKLVARLTSDLQSSKLQQNQISDENERLINQHESELQAVRIKHTQILGERNNHINELDRVVSKHISELQVTQSQLDERNEQISALECLISEKNDELMKTQRHHREEVDKCNLTVAELELLLSQQIHDNHRVKCKHNQDLCDYNNRLAELEQQVAQKIEELQNEIDTASSPFLLSDMSQFLESAMSSIGSLYRGNFVDAFSVPSLRADYDEPISPVLCIAGHELDAKYDAE